MHTFSLKSSKLYLSLCVYLPYFTLGCVCTMSVVCICVYVCLSYVCVWFFDTEWLPMIAKTQSPLDAWTSSKKTVALCLVPINANDRVIKFSNTGKVSTSQKHVDNKTEWAHIEFKSNVKDNNLGPVNQFARLMDRLTKMKSLLLWTPIFKRKLTGLEPLAICAISWYEISQTSTFHETN